MNDDLQLIDDSSPIPLYRDLTARQPVYLTKWGKRFGFNESAGPAVRLATMLQAMAAISLPKATKVRIDECGVLILTGRHGDEEAVYPETPEAFRGCVKRLHSINDAKEGGR